MMRVNTLSKIISLLLVAMIGLLAGCSPAFWNALNRGTNNYIGGRPFRAIAVAKNDEGASVSAYGISYVSLSEAAKEALSKCRVKRKRKGIQDPCKLMNTGG